MNNLNITALPIVMWNRQMSSELQTAAAEAKDIKSLTNESVTIASELCLNGLHGAAE